MIEEKTVMVVGAGGSVPYDFPTGSTLRDEILRHMVWGPGYWGPILSKLGYAQIDVETFNKNLRYSGLASVDAFLGIRTEFMELGKTAIALELIPLERVERIFSDSVADDWYQYVWNRMVTPTYEKLFQNRLSIVTFNYDRSLEFFLHQAVCSTYDKSDEEAWVFLEYLPIIHVHGRLGGFPWENSVNGKRLYRELLTPETVIAGRESLIVLPEAQDDSTEFAIARKLLNEATRVCFLGFGYHDENMRRLHAKDYKSKISGSAFGLGLAERHVIEKKWGINLVRSDHDLSTLDCLAFLRDRFALI